MIELDSELDIQTVTEIFIRINSKGVVLSQADFAMSKIASSDMHDGPQLRKLIDYFCHLAIAPEVHKAIEANDPSFASTSDYTRIRWLSREKDDLYDPDYSDVLRVAFTSQYSRARLEDLVSLLSGRNFEARTYEGSVAADTFSKLRGGVERFVNETNFKSFVMIVKSAGFVRSRLIRSQNVLNMAYIVYLRLKAEGVEPAVVERLVRRWLVMSILTARYAGSPESAYESDVRQMNERGFVGFLEFCEQSELSEAFWAATLPNELATSAVGSPYFNLFLVAQAYAGDRGFLSEAVTVRDMLVNKGDIHHVFPKQYLKNQGLEKDDYNQVANYVYMQTEINIKVGSRSPREYLSMLLAQIDSAQPRYGGIRTREELRANLATHCLPEMLLEATWEDYPRFLGQRRVLMASRIRIFYDELVLGKARCPDEAAVVMGA